MGGGEGRYIVRRGFWFPFPVFHVYDTKGKWAVHWRKGDIYANIPYRRRRGTFFRKRTAEAYADYLRRRAK